MAKTQQWNAIEYEDGKEMAENDFVVCREENLMRREGAFRLVAAGSDHEARSFAMGYQETTDRLWREHYVTVVAQELQEAGRLLIPCERDGSMDECDFSWPCQECLQHCVEAGL